ncbi:MAG: hypothetical protein H6Q69_2367, partial [Firmicutes bacterium]|nr:hypothetical protein [Bacillota bacterium]
MLGLNYKLEELEKNGKNILTGIIGAGQMGKGMISQMTLMKGMTPAVVVDINIENAKKAFLHAGIDEGNIKYAKTAAEADAFIKDGKSVIADHSDVATKSEFIQVVIDATGVTEIGAKIALDTILGKKHIVMLNAEADVVIGPVLKK